MSYHNAVLLQESVKGLNINPSGVYVDVTFGGGGHSKEILKHLNQNGKLFAFDQDKDALQNNINDDRFLLINENFRYLKRFLRFNGVQKVDGILADLGVSSHQFDVPERGFSTRYVANLDMRMNASDELSAYKVINTYEEKELKKMFFEYGELKNAGAIANKIIEARKTKDIKTSEDFKSVVSKFLPPHKTNKILAKMYQAIRIEVNSEIEALKEFLLQSLEVLNTNGRLSVISYHSLEDRLVKRFMRNGMFEGEPERDIYGRYQVPFTVIEKLIIPSEQEIEENNRARSAKLRVAEKN